LPARPALIEGEALRARATSARFRVAGGAWILYLNPVEE